MKANMLKKLVLKNYLRRNLDLVHLSKFKLVASNWYQILLNKKLKNLHLQTQILLMISILHRKILNLKYLLIALKWIVSAMKKSKQMFHIKKNNLKNSKKRAITIMVKMNNLFNMNLLKRLEKIYMKTSHNDTKAWLKLNHFIK